MKTIRLLAVAAILVAGSVMVFREHLVAALFAKALDHRMAQDVASDLVDGLHVAVCGAGGPLASARASGPCLAVMAGEQLIIVDAGTNGVRNLGRMGIQPGGIDAVFLTHFHSDHIDGLGELATQRWVSVANTEPLPVYGPSGVEQVVSGFNMAYAQDYRYRAAHHGDIVAPQSGAGLQAVAFALPETGGISSVYEQEGLRIEVFEVEHSPVHPAVAYRFTYKQRTLLISGDTKASARLEEYAKGVDLLVHEALASNLVAAMHDAAVRANNPVTAKIMSDIPDYHATPLETAGIARRAGVGHLLYYHIVPPLVIPGQRQLFLNGADDVFDAFTIAMDGTLMSMPAQSSEITLVKTAL